MERAITSEGFRDLLLAASDAIIQEENHLSALDSAIGDGDHGVTMRLGFHAIRKSVEYAPGEAVPGQLFCTAGREFMRSTGGAIGVILGRAFISAGEAFADRKHIGAEDWKRCFQAMEQIVRSTGKAEPGDKTLLDPLHAINTALADVGNDSDCAGLMAVAADAAERAAEATAQMHCRKGRASRLGDRALGHADPGAVSFSIIVRAFANGIREMQRAGFSKLG